MEAEEISQILDLTEFKLSEINELIEECLKEQFLNDVLGDNNKILS